MAEQTSNQTADIDPRLAAIIAGRSPYERFMALSMAAAMPAEQRESILRQVRPGTPDMNRTVAGRPLLWWVGKSEEQLRREVGRQETVDEIIAAVETAGGTVAEVTPEMDAAATAEDRSRSRVIVPRRPEPRAPDAKLPERSPDSVARAVAVTTEETFGDESIPFSELRGKSDGELRKVRGVGSSSIVRIRQLEAEYASREADAERRALAANESHRASIMGAKNTTNPALAAGTGGPSPAGAFPVSNRTDGQDASTFELDDDSGDDESPAGPVPPEKPTE